MQFISGSLEFLVTNTGVFLSFFFFLQNCHYILLFYMKLTSNFIMFLSVQRTVINMKHRCHWDLQLLFTMKYVKSHRMYLENMCIPLDIPFYLVWPWCWTLGESLNQSITVETKTLHHVVPYLTLLQFLLLTWMAGFLKRAAVCVLTSVASSLHVLDETTADVMQHHQPNELWDMESNLLPSFC